MPQSSTQLFARPTLLALAAAACVSAIAQENTQTLSEVVVSASGFEQQIKDAPASISVVTREDLQKKSFRDLADALSDVEGIDVKGGTGKTGGFDISIRGMPSEYTLILVDGRRTSAAGETTPNGFAASQTSLIPPLSAIERIEIVRGPMSTLYGSDAMGGVINIITRKVAKEWTGSFQLEGSIPENSGQGSTQKTTFYLNGPIKNDLLGIALRGNYYNRDKTDLNLPDGLKESNIKGVAPAKSDQYTIGTRLTLTPKANQEFWLDLESARTEYDNRICELGNVDFTNCGSNITRANGYKDYLKFNRDQYVIGYKGKSDIGLLESSLSHISNKTKGRTLPYDASPVPGYIQGAARKLQSDSTIWDTKLVTTPNEYNILSIGSQYIKSTAHDGIPAAKGKPTKFDQNTWALFAENEWSITDTLIATGGLRYDHHDRFGGHWTPRAYLVWNTTEFLTFKGGVSQGFKAPKINDLIDGLAGLSSQGRTETYGNPDLKPEKSTSTEISLIFNNQKNWTANVTIFHNKIKNKIQSIECGQGYDIASCPNPTPTSNIPQFPINRDKATTHGFEVGSKFTISPQWRIAANYTWTNSEVEEKGIVVGKLTNTPKHIANATLNWTPSAKTSLWLQAEYRGSSERFAKNNSTGNTLINEQRQAAVVGDKLKAYSLLNLGGQYKVNKNLTLSATIYNLTNKNFNKFFQWTNTDGDIQYANPYYASGSSVRGSMPEGRTLWVRANIEF